MIVDIAEDVMNLKTDLILVWMGNHDIHIVNDYELDEYQFVEDEAYKICVYYDWLPGPWYSPDIQRKTRFMFTDNVPEKEIADFILRFT